MAPGAASRQCERVAAIDIIGVYAVEAREPCHLVELQVTDSPGWFDVGVITQRDPERPPTDWQVPYAEKVLTDDGDGVMWDLWDGPGDDGMWLGTLRLAFFMHHLDLERPLSTPFGEVPLPAPNDLPDRLRDIEYEEP